MSTTVDTKVVEMRFDNAQFEKNTNQTMSTLDKLKAKLDFAGHGKSIEELETKFQRINPVVQNCTTSFGELAAQVAGLRILTNVVDDLYSKTTQLVKSMTIDNVATGWDKFTQKTANVQTIMNATGLSVDQVSAKLDKLMRFSDETSFNFTEMASSLATFVNSGIDIDSSVNAIMGIANATAYAGKSGFDFQRTIRNLTQSYSTGALNLLDWKSLEGAGTNSLELQKQLIKAAEDLGKINPGDITLQNFRDTLKDKWADVDVMNLAFSRFSEFSDKAFAKADELGIEVSEAMELISGETSEFSEQAFRAGQQCKSFADVLDYIKDEVSSSFMRSFEAMFGKFDEASEFWTDMGDAFHQIFGVGVGDLEDWITQLMGSPWDELYAKIEDLGIPVEEFQNALVAATGATKEDLEYLMELTGKASPFEALLDEGYIDDDLIAYTLENYNEILGKTITTEEALMQTQEELKKNVIDTILGTYDNGRKRIEKFAEAGLDYAQVQGIVNQVWDGQRINYELLNELTAQNTEFTEEQAAALRDLCDEINLADGPWQQLLKDLSDPRSGRQLFLDTIRNTLNGIIAILNPLRDALKETFGIPVSDARQFLIWINHLSERFAGLEEKSDELRRTFKGVFAIFGIFTDIIRDAATIAMRIFGNLVGDANLSVLDLSAGIGDAIVAFREWLNENGVIISLLEKLVDGIHFVVVWVGNLVDQFMHLPEVEAVVANLAYKFEDFANKIKSFFSTGDISIKGFRDLWKEAGDDISSSNDGPTDAIDQKMEKLAEKPKALLEKIKMALDNVLNAFKTALTAVKNGIFNAFSEIKVNVQKFVQTISDAFAGISWGKVIGIGFLIATFRAIASIANAIELIANPFGAAGKAFEKLGKSMDKLIKAEKARTNAMAVREIATAIALLAASLKIISTIDSASLNRSMEIVLVLTVAVAGLTGLVILLGGLTAGLPKLYVSLVGFALCITALAGAIQKISKIDAMDAMRSTDILIKLMKQMMWTFSIIVLASKTFQSLYAGGGMQIFNSMSGLAVGMLAFSVSLKIMVSALGDIAKMDVSKITIDKLYIVGGCLTAMVFIARLCGGVGTIGTAATIIGMVIALKMMLDTIASIKIGKIEQWFAGIIGAAAMAPALIVLMMALENASKYAIRAGIGMIALSAAMVIMVGVVKLLSMFSIAEIVQGELAVLGLAGIFVGLMAATKLAAKDMPKVAAMLLSFSGAMVILVGLMAVLAFFSPSEIAKGLVVIGALGGIIIAVVAMARHARNASKSLGMIEAIFVTIGVLLVLLSSPLFDTKKVLLTCAGLVGIFGGLALMFLAMSKVRSLAFMSKKALGTIVGVMAIVAAFVVGMGIGTMFYDATSALAAVGAMTLLMLGLVPFMLALDKVGTLAAGIEKTLIALGVSLAAVGVITTLIGLAFTKWELDPIKTLEAVAAMAILMLAMCPMLLAMKMASGISIPDAKAMGGLYAAIAGAFVAVAGMGLVIQGMQLDMTNIIAATASMAILMLAMCPMIIAMKVASGLATGDTLANALAVAAVVVVAGIIVGAVAAVFQDAGVSFETAIGAATALSEFMLAISVAMLIMSLAGAWGDPKAIIEGLGGIVAIVAVAGAIIWALGELTNIYGDNGVLDAGIECLNKIAYGIGSFISNLVAGVAFGSLPAIGESLGGFFTNISGALGSVDGDAFQNAASLMDALAKITWGSFVSSLLEPFMGDNDWTSFGKGLGDFGDAMKDFSDKCAGINEAGLNKGINGTGLLADVSKKIPNSGLSVVSIFVGDNDWEHFGKGLAKYGEALTTFSLTCSVMSIPGIAFGVKATEKLSEVATYLPNSGPSFASIFFGDNDWEHFGKGLAEYGEALATFARNCTGISLPAIILATDVTKRLAEAEASLPKETGWATSFFSTTQNWDTFQTGLITYGGALGSFAYHTKDMKRAPMKSAVEATAGLAEIAAKIATIKTEDFKSWKTLGDGLDKLGEGLHSFFDNVQNVPYESACQAVSLTQSLLIAANDFTDNPLTDGSMDWTTMQLSLVDLTNTLSGFVTQISPLSAELVKANMSMNYVKGIFDSLAIINDAEFTQIDTVTVSLIGLVNALSKYGELNNAAINAANQAVAEISFDSWTSFMNDLTSNLNTLTQANNMLEQTLTQAAAQNDTAVSTSFRRVGFNAAQGFVLGFTTGKEAIVSIVADIAKEMYDRFQNEINYYFDPVSAASTTLQISEAAVKELENTLLSSLNLARDRSKTQVAQDFRSVGNHVISGIITGMNNSQVQLDNKVAQVSQRLLQKLETSLSIHSPSKETAWMGEMLNLGLTNGLKDNKDMLKTVYKSGRQVIATMQDAVGVHSESTDGHYMGWNIGAGTDSGITDWLLKKGYHVYTSGMTLITKFGAGIEAKYPEIMNKIKSLGFDSISELMTGGYSLSDIQNEIKDMLKDSGIKSSEFDEYLNSFGIGNEHLQTAKKEFDDYLTAYKEGRMSQSQFDEAYTNLLQRYTEDQVGILQYGQEKLTDYVEKTFDTLNKDYEKQLSNIQKKMDDTKNKVVESLESAFKITTNKDVYDEGLKKITDEISDNNEEIYDLEWERDQKLKKLNKDREKYEKAGLTYSVERLDNEIEEYTKKMNEKINKVKEKNEELSHAEHLYKRDYEDSKKKDTKKKDEDIVGVEFENDLEEKTKLNDEYNAEIKKLRQNATEDYDLIISILNQKDTKTGFALAKYFNSLSLMDLQKILDQYREYENSGVEITTSLYGPEVQKATEDYVDSIVNTVSTLPESAQEIGANMAISLANGFSAETEATLATIKTDADQINRLLTDIFFPSEESKLFYKQQSEENTPKIAVTTIVDYDVEMEKHRKELQKWGALPVEADLIVDYDQMMEEYRNRTTFGDPITVPAVIDTSGIQEITTAIEVDNSNVQTSVDLMSTNIGSKLDDNTAALKTYNETIDSKLDDIANKDTAIYLDTGVLVGTLGPEMDNNLGFRASIASRTTGGR